MKVFVSASLAVWMRSRIYSLLLPSMCSATKHPPLVCLRCCTCQAPLTSFRWHTPLWVLLFSGRSTDFSTQYTIASVNLQYTLPYLYTCIPSSLRRLYKRLFSPFILYAWCCHFLHNMWCHILPHLPLLEVYSSYYFFLFQHALFRPVFVL